MAYEIVCSNDNRESWLRARRSGIGASEIAAACGESPWDSPFSLWAKKSRMLPEKDETEPMTWGRLLEPVIIGEYARRAGRSAKPHGLLLRSKDYPWALATLDGTTWGDGDSPWPLEIKNTSAYLADEWQDGPPPHYYLQVQQQALVTGARKVTSACLLGGNRLVWCDVDRDERVIRKIIERGSDLWRRVQSGEAPEVDGSDATHAALDAMYPKDERRSILLDGAMINVADEIEAMKSRIRDAKEKVDDLEATVKAALGSARSGILPDGREFTWTLQQRAGFTVKPTEFRVLRLKKAKKEAA